MDSIRTNIQNDIASANNAIQGAVNRINVSSPAPQVHSLTSSQSVTKLVDVTLTVPPFDIPSLTALQNVTIPSTFESALLTLNKSLPDLSELKAKMNSIIDTPFELLITEINNTRIEMAASFNSSVLPVPPLNQLAANNGNDLANELCSGLDTSLIDDTAKALHKLSNIAIGLMFLLLFLVWAALLVWEWRRWRAMKSTVDAVEAEWRREGTKDPWRMVAIVEHPVLEKYGSVVLERIAPAPRTRTNLRWFCE